jgi:crotonobetainyl-CoA:carnitine CoA-transferase CaiB-like acyl-CoA transferase
MNNLHTAELDTATAGEQAESAGSQRGLRIVDFSTHLSGPIASHLLMEMGATVIKIENPRSGDGNRGAFEVKDGVGLMHLALNSGARSLSVDRHSDEWPRVVDACARWADAAVVGTRPVDARRRGMDFLTMRRANPDIVYCSISGFAENGPWKDHTAHGQTIDSYAGLVDTVPGGLQPQTRPGWRTAGTTLGGVFAALGILNALLRRERGQARAQYLSVSLWQAAMWWSWRDLTMLANTGEPWVDYSDLGSRYSLYATADDRVLLVAPVEQKFWRTFCDLVGFGEDDKSRGTWGLSGMEFGVGDEFADERERIAGAIGKRTLQEWIDVLDGSDIPFAPVLTLNEALASEHAAVNGLMRTTVAAGREFKLPATPVRDGGEGEELSLPGPLSSPPDIGEHSAEILRELGLDDIADARS